MEDLSFESFGVRFRVDSASVEILEAIRGRLELVFGPLISFSGPRRAGQVLRVDRTDDGQVEIFDGHTDAGFIVDSGAFARTFESIVRNRVAEMATGHVFLHAGAVAIDGKALIMPGRSFTGKTTLVKVLAERGAVYYSDDFAVLDPDAGVLPFPKPLSVRDPDGGRGSEDVRIGEIGARSGSDTVPCGLVLFTEFLENSVWAPRKISGAAGLLKLIEHSVAIRTNAGFVLKVLNKLALRAIIAQSYRAEADVVATSILDYFNQAVLSSCQD